MKNNSLLILLVVVIGFGVLCAIVAGIAFSYYNNDLLGPNVLRTDPLLAPEKSENSTDLSKTEPQSSADSSSILESPNLNAVYLTELMQEYQMCQNQVSIFMATITELETDPTLQNDEEYLDSLKTSLVKINSNCSELGREENIPEEYTKLNDELRLVNENVFIFTENYLKWIDDHKTEYIIAGNEAFSAVAEHVQKANQLLQDALVP